VWKIPGEVGGHPWFIATLFDTCWAFFTFYCWLFYRESGALARALWLLGIICLRQHRHVDLHADPAFPVAA